jgi:uncharacterized repeat protein (TIGR04076 family)
MFMRHYQGEKMTQNDAFTLFDLEIVVEKIEGHCTCNMEVGNRFYLRSGKLSLPDGQDFCLYALQAAIPLLPAKQRQNHAADWIETDNGYTRCLPGSSLPLDYAYRPGSGTHFISR